MDTHIQPHSKNTHAQTHVAHEREHILVILNRPMKDGEKTGFFYCFIFAASVLFVKQSSFVMTCLQAPVCITGIFS